MGTIIYILRTLKMDCFYTQVCWAIVTYHCRLWNIAPQTSLGQFFASIIMILGYSIIAVPTGLISIELSKTSLNTQSCRSCSLMNTKMTQFSVKFVETNLTQTANKNSPLYRRVS